MKLNDAVFGAVLLLLGVVVLVHVQSFPPIPGQKYGPAICSRASSPPDSSSAPCC